MGHPVSDGQEGEILVTSLSNYAMPLIRYSIGDRGIFLRQKERNGGPTGGFLETVTGRSADMFRTAEGALIHPGYFMVILFFKDWIEQYQVIHKSYSHVLFRIVKGRNNYRETDLDEMAAKTRQAIGSGCKVEFEFLQEIPPGPSGKHRYTISEVHLS